MQYNKNLKIKHQFKDLKEFLNYLKKIGHLKEINEPVSTYLEITEISKRFLHKNGPALLFTNVIGEVKNDRSSAVKYQMPVVTNLFAHEDRIAIGLGLEDKSLLRELGHLLAFLKHPQPPSSFKEIVSMAPLMKKIIAMSPKITNKALCQQVIIDEPDLSILPINKCWPGDVSPLITWPIVITKNIADQDKNNDIYNLGIYRLQPIAKNKVIVRWLNMRGGMEHHNKWKQKYPNGKMPVNVAIGASPIITLSAVMPIPTSLSEYSFSGLMQGNKIELVKAISNDLLVPATAQIILEGEIDLNEYADEGPFGDHTGYYNDVEKFPVMTINKITMTKEPIYLSTYTGKPPDEPAILGKALNEIFIPLIQNQFSEIVDFYLPPEGCSYRIAIVSIKKKYPGHAARIAMGVWSYLQQFMYTKFVIIVDDDIDIRDWKEVMWAISTRVDPKRDSIFLENTPIDYLDFASPDIGLGSKIAIDATNKIYPETKRNWGEEINMSKDVIDKIDQLWEKININKD